MTNFEIRKKLYEMLGRAIIYTNEFHNMNLMPSTSYIHHIILDIYVLLSNPKILSFTEETIEDDSFLLEKFSFVGKELDEHFISSYLTAENVQTVFDEKEWEEKVMIFTSLISEPKKQESKKFSGDVFDEEG